MVSENFGDIEYGKNNPAYKRLMEQKQGLNV